MESTDQTNEMESLLRAEYRQWGVLLENILQKTLQTSLSFALSEIRSENVSEILKRSFSKNIFAIVTLSKNESCRIGIDFSRLSLEFFLDQMLGGFDGSDNFENKDALYQSSQKMTLLEKRLHKKMIALIFKSFFYSQLNCDLDSNSFNESSAQKNSIHSSQNENAFIEEDSPEIAESDLNRNADSQIDNETDSIIINEESIPNWILQEPKRIVSYELRFLNRTETISFFLDTSTEKRFFPHLFSQFSEQKNFVATKLDVREVIIEIGQIRMSPEKLSSLKIGDILKTDVPADSPFFIKWDNVLHFSGKPGLYQGIPSIQIEKEL
ncbi:MAG: FliM/FliN family flagellar motor C-terminal domain-containing protein [Planctomycetia bacterium]|nr:FliM/FliN family flagellar motor C-terminal domain-containing protein [Planctomycetia bacterium]